MAWLSRDEWGATPPEKQLNRMVLPVSTVYLHHTVTPVSSDPRADMRRMVNSVVPSKYVDCPYNVVVHPDGTILTGRYLGGLPALGAHTSGQNSVSLGIAVLGNYVDIPPTSQSVESVARVIEAFVKQGFVTATFTLRSHSEVKQTACCGTQLRAQIADIYQKTKQFVGGTPPVYVPTPVKQTPQPARQTYPAYPMVLKRGSRGVHVRTLQQRLRDRGWTIGVDGIYGAQTEKVVRAYQKEKRLAVDGIVGRQTWISVFTAKVT